MDTGELISLYRKEAMLTIDELAELSGVPKGTLNKIIAGTTKAPTLDNMKAIAHALGKNLSDFDEQHSIKFNPKEIALIKKYRSLDEKAKDIIDTLLDKVYIYSSERTYNVAAKGNANKQIDSDTAKNLAKAADKAPNLADKEFL